MEVATGLLAAVLLCAAPATSVRVWPSLPDPTTHPLVNRSRVAGADWAIFSPVPGRKLPGWAALRFSDKDLADMDATWVKIDK